MSDENNDLDNAVAIDDTQVDTAAQDPVEDNPGDADDGLSQSHTADTAPQAVAQPAPGTPPPLDYEKSYKELRPSYTRATQELAELKRTWQGFDPQQVRSVMEENARRQQMANASPFSRRHPDFAKNSSRLERADMFIKAAQGMEDDQARQMAARMGITAEDLKLHSDAKAYREGMIQDFIADPDAFIAERVEDLVTKRMQDYDTWNMGRANAERWLADPNHSRYLNEHAQDIHRMLDPNVPIAEKIAFMGEALSRNRALEAQLGKTAETVSQAQAQQNALRTRTQGAGRSSGRAPTFKDAADYVARGLKLKPDHPDYITKLAQANQRLAAGENL